MNWFRTRRHEPVPDRTHLAVRHRNGEMSAVLTLSDGHEIDLSRLALSEGFGISGIDGEIETRSITLSCKLVITELDVDIDVLRAQMVDAAGQDVSLDALAASLNAGGAR